MEGRQGESRWTSLHRGNESIASKFLREAGLAMKKLLESIDDELLDTITLDRGFAERWRQKDVYFIYCLAHQAAVRDYQFSVYFSLQCLFELEITNNDYKNYFVDFNNIWEDITYACPNPEEALGQWLSGKVAHDLCSVIGEGFLLLHNDVKRMIGGGLALPDHEALIRRWSKMLRTEHELRQVGPNRSNHSPETEFDTSFRLDYMSDWQPWHSLMFVNLGLECQKWLNTRRRPVFKVEEPLDNAQFDDEGEPLLHPPDHRVPDLRDRQVCFVHERWLCRRRNVDLSEMDEWEQEAVIERYMEARRDMAKQSDDFEHDLRWDIAKFLMTILPEVRLRMYPLWRHDDPVHGADLPAMVDAAYKASTGSEGPGEAYTVRASCRG